MITHPVVETVVSALVSQMLLAVPPERHNYARPASEHETVEQVRERYQTIASSVVSAAYDPGEEPMFEGVAGRFQTAQLMLAVALYESGYRKDVQTGIGRRSRGDHGRSCTIWQFHLGKDTDRWGSSCSDLYADPDLAAHRALTAIRSSWSSCKALSPEYRLSQYMGGKCFEHEPAKARYATWARWRSKVQAPAMDLEVVKLLRND